MEDFQAVEDTEQDRSCNGFQPDACRSHLVAWLLQHCSACSKFHMVLLFLGQVLGCGHLLVACSQTVFLSLEWVGVQGGG